MTGLKKIDNLNSKWFSSKSILIHIILKKRLIPQKNSKYFIYLDDNFVVSVLPTTLPLPEF